MTDGRIIPIFVKFSLPLLFGNFFQILYSMTDSWVVGNYVGSLSLAAIGASGNIIFTVTGFFNGLANGAGVVISQAFGVKDKKRLLNTVHTVFISSIVSGFFCSTKLFFSLGFSSLLFSFLFSSSSSSICSGFISLVPQ